jgi:hypothetical protein
MSNLLSSKNWMLLLRGHPLDVLMFLNHFLSGIYSFKTNYPNWEPDGNGKQFMSVLADFRLRNEEYDLSMGQLFSSVRLPQPPNQLRPWGAPMPGNSLYTRSFNSTVRDRFGPNIPFARPSPANGASSDLQRSLTQHHNHLKIWRLGYCLMEDIVKVGERSQMVSVSGTVALMRVYQVGLMI